MRSHGSLETRLYRAALHLCPPAFYREFSREMALDFDEARREASLAAARRALWAFRAHVSTDLARTIVVQWLRTGLPLIAIASMIGPMIAVWVLSSMLGRVRVVLPAGDADAELIGVFMVVVVILLVISATIIFTLGFLGPLLYRRRP